MACPVGGVGGAGNVGDIIDLDRYMRASVRRSASDTTDDERIERLVVDGGGGGVGVAGAGGAGGTGGKVAGSSSSAECAARVPPHHKRFSHDSGLSDGSYAPRARRPHRRVSAAEGGGRGAREGRLPRAANNSSNSLREFRAACERALLDQQQQIARVALLCERLTEKRSRVPPAPPAAVPAPAEPDTSDISSSSTSTKDQRRKDKHRADECKTYKIIMNKLDELNRLFAARGRSPGGPAPPRSVCVSDKLVATEPRPKLTAKPSSQPSRRVAGRVAGCVAGRGAGRGAERAAGGGEGSAERRVVRAVTQAYALDIAPKHVMAAVTRNRDRPNVATESIVEHGSTGEEYASSTADPRCGFDLDDPLHLYAQAKRLQALHACGRRSRSTGAAPAPAASARRDHRAGSLCALCRGYWRAVRRYIDAQLTGPAV